MKTESDWQRLTWQKSLVPSPVRGDVWSEFVGEMLINRDDVTLCIWEVSAMVALWSVLVGCRVPDNMLVLPRKVVYVGISAGWLH